MASCIEGGQGYGHAEKHPHISYLYGRFVAEETPGWRSAYGEALAVVCTKTRDVEHWRSLHEPSLPDAIPEDYAGRNRLARAVLMQADILEKAGDGTGLEDLFRRYRGASFDICYAHVKYVAKSDPRRAPEVAEEAARLFPRYRSGLMYAAGADDRR